MTKTEFLLIGSRQRLITVTVSPTLAMNDFRVTQVATAKSLGVTIDDNLDWGSHMKKIIKKVSFGIGAVKRVRHLVPQATSQLIYQALIHPHFNYCNTVWGNFWIILKNQLQKVQNRAARVLTFSDYDEVAGYLFELLGWKNLARQHETEIEKATMVYKSLHRLAPEYLCSRFAIRERHITLETENKLCIPLPRTNYHKNSFSYSGAILWNKLPCNVRQAESLTKFKCLLKQVL